MVAESGPAYPTLVPAEYAEQQRAAHPNEAARDLVVCAGSSVWQRILAGLLNELVGCIEPAENVVHRRSFTPTKATGHARSLAAGDDAPDSRASLMAP
jgi:hypothetical protein